MQSGLMRILRSKIEKRAILVAILLILLVAGLGQFSLSRLASLHEIITEMSSEHVPRLRLVTELSSNSERLRNLQSLSLLTKEPTLKEGVATRLRTVAEKRRAQWQALATAPKTEGEKEALTRVAKTWEEYSVLADQAIALHALGNEEGAVSIFNTQAQIAMDKYRAALRVYEELAINTVQTMASAGDSLYIESRLIITCVFLFVVPMALLAGVSVASLWV